MEKKLGLGITAVALTAGAWGKVVPVTPEEDAEFAEAMNAMRSQDLECRQNMAGDITVGPSVVKMIRRDRERIKRAEEKRARKAARYAKS